MLQFNIAGPCKPELHYMLPPTVRLADANVHRLIAGQNYFVLHAPRQVGKTTAMTNLAQELTASGQYAAVLLSVEVGAAFPDNVDAAERAILSSWRSAIEFTLPPQLHPPLWQPDAAAGQQIGRFLTAWARALARPLVAFLDEIDALRDDVLISVLRQLRAGYTQRPQAFPAALALIGLRDVRDYRVMAGGSHRLGTASPFNILTRSILLRDFTVHEVQALLHQHTAATGQDFTAEARQLVFDLTLGQPWLVNALARSAVEEIVADLAQPITAAHIEQAKELLIERRQTHLDQLTDKLREPRVRRVIEPIIAGVTLGDVPADDIEYVLDLGLCRLDPRGGLVIANPIYREVLPRLLAFTARASLPLIMPTWLTATGELDLQRLLDAFLTFWRQHGQPLLRTAHYHEIAPHLVLMAFLDRVVNGGGILEREYAVGSDRLDLYLRYGVVRLGIELKVWRTGRPDPLNQGLEQLDSYLNRLSVANGWLVIFDQRAGQPDLSIRTTAESATTPSGRQVIVIQA